MTGFSMQTSLVYSVILTFVMIQVASFGKGRYWTPVGLMFGMSNRDDSPETLAWARRADRAAKNMMENLLLFGALVVAAQGMGISNDATTLGATLFFWARLIYFPIYVAGVTWIRSGIWMAGLIGMVIIALELI